jgi:hypothetical protein
MSTHADIIKRLEAATGPDRGLDGIIARDVEHWIPHFDLDGDDLLDWPDMGGHWHSPGDPSAFRCAIVDGALEPPHYTASIDAALALVERMLPGWGWNISCPDKYYNETNFYALVVSDEDNGAEEPWDIERDVFEASGKTAPLAILLALFRALERQDSDK